VAKRRLMALAAAGAAVLAFMSAACDRKPAAVAPAGGAPRAAAPAPMPVAAPPALVAPAAWPSGQRTPEGVACDLARAFIVADGKLLRASCFVITPGTPERDAYNNFLDETFTAMDVAGAVPGNQEGWPVAIERVYRARALSSPAGAAFGLDQLGLTDVRFVDMRVGLRGGKTGVLRRTLVVQDEGSKLWLAVPHPENFPKLSEGLGGETESVEDWKP
jgi:hypothetical protein